MVKIHFLCCVGFTGCNGLVEKNAHKDPNWVKWIHAAVFIHFIIGAFYSGVRMLTTDEMNDMLIRRIYACEA
ncbi:MAG: hypothetical protein ISR95_03980 [Candidatus Marinimicrobia bacterium]|nr:hypothetical protein [Candidatus Neomarinimicrobiota bacterium]